MPSITLVFLTYFGYSSIHGDFGLQASARFEKQIAVRQQKLAVLEMKRKALDRQVHLLSDGSIQKDMLDEEAREQLNLSRPDEVVILN